MSENDFIWINKLEDIPLIALRGLVIFPKAVLSLEIGRAKSQEAVEKAITAGSMLFAVSQRDAVLTEPTEEDINNTGTVMRVIQIIKLPNNVIKIIGEGQDRARIANFTQTEPFFRVTVDSYKTNDAKVTKKLTAAVRMVHETYKEYARLSKKITKESLMTVINSENAGDLADLIGIHSQMNYKDKQLILEETNQEKRISLVLKILKKEIDILNLQDKIAVKLKESIEKNQRNSYLREQIKIINEELGDDDGPAGEVKAYRERMDGLKLPEHVTEKLNKELNRLSRMTLLSAESVVIRDYIDCVLDMPWTTSSEESTDLKKAAHILDKDHYGLENVKERIIEFLAVRQMTSKLDAPIICLVGPPGVGKTSVAKSMAKALNRKYVRLSLGGVRDEAEIRGHRKTYIGAMSGRIISAMKQAGTRNPLILLDEIDKLSSDYKGDPSSALLEVLDAEQNKYFRDNYLELAFDLSEVLFICTANTMDTVQKALKDRLEVVELSSYTTEEKCKIATDFLIKKQLKKHGLKKSSLKLDKEVVNDIIKHYTKEAGVRELERLIGKICRKAVKEILTEDKKSLRVTQENLQKYLGKRKYRHDKINEKPEIGVCKGLAWTAYGGETLSIEVNIMRGTGKLELTGNMGQIMKESAMAAISYLKSRSEEFGLAKNFQKETDIHIHIPDGAVPKDGPSAGITMACAMASVFTKKPVRNDIGMTGEITIRGRVLPIGGLKEKLLAAKNAGLKKVIIPTDNTPDLDDLPEYVKSGLEIYTVDNMSDVLERALIYDS